MIFKRAYFSFIFIASFISFSWASDAFYRENIYQVRVNNFSVLYSLICLESEGDRLLISDEDWVGQLKLNKPNNSFIEYNDQLYYDLSSLNGISYHLDKNNLFVNIDVEAFWFPEDKINLLIKKEKIDNKALSSTGVFLNYDFDVFGSSNEYGYNLSNKLVFFSPYGNIENSFNYSSLQKIENKLQRLDSTMIYKNQNHLITLRLGDNVSEDLGISGGIRFAGVQIKKDYTLEPQINTMFLPSMQLSSKLPSTLDLFVNNNKQFSKDIGAGVFTLQDIPVVSGVGVVKAVLKDSLGGVQEIYLPYYASIDLLKKGLYEYSIDAGFERQNYALNNDNYGEFMSVLSYRRGLSQYMTAEGQWYHASQQDVIRYGGVFSLGYLGSLKAWIISNLNNNRQQNAYGGVLRTQYKFISGNMSWQKVDSDLNLSGASLDVSSKLGMALSLSFRDKGTLDMLYILTKKNPVEQQYYRIGYNYPLSKYGFINISANYNKDKDDVEAQILFSTSLTKKDRISLALTDDGQKGLSFNSRYNKDFGYSFNVANKSYLNQYNANLMFSNAYSDYQFRSKYENDVYTNSLDMQGSLIFLNNDFFASKTINDSFSVVDLGGYKDVRVYSNNQFVGYTNKDGVIVVNNLQEYQENKLRIDTVDLPLNVKINMPDRVLLPSYNSGIYIKYNLQKEKSATLTVVLDDGKDAPMGMQVLDASGGTFMVGYNGELYLDRLLGHDILKLVWKNQECQIKIDPIGDDQIIPHLGNYVCHGVIR